MIDLLFMSGLYKTEEETIKYQKKIVDTLIVDGKLDCTLAHIKKQNLSQSGGFRIVLKHQLMALLVKEYNSEYFVETGTYMAETTTALSPLFKKCWSVEASKVHFDFSVYRLSPPLRDNVELLYGESQVQLPKILEMIKKESSSASKDNNIIFFLDAHFSGSSDGDLATFKSEFGPCPTLQELEAIRDSGINNSIILIDDYSSFGVSKGYPTSDDILKVVKEINPSYEAVYIPEADCLKISLDSGIGGSL